MSKLLFRHTASTSMMRIVFPYLLSTLGVVGFAMFSRMDVSASIFFIL